MTDPSYALLDQQELLQLAVDASRCNNGAAALSYLKEAVLRPDATAQAHFLLGSEYAQLRMYDHALREMGAAVALAPSLWIARFQLGLLLLSSGDSKSAQEVLEPLVELDDRHYLAHFGNGLLHLMRDEFAAAALHLKKGVQLNGENPALNGDMQKILDKVAELAPQANISDESSGLDDEFENQHIFLSAYKGKTNH